jgi:TolB protein
MVTIIAALLLVTPLWAQQVYIKLGQARVEKSPLAIVQPKFLGSPTKNPNHSSLSHEIREILSRDLSVLGYFKLQSANSFIESPSQSGLKPVLPGVENSNGFLWESWKSIGTDFLIRLGFDINGSDLVLDVYAYHVPKAEVILAQKYSGPLLDMRRIMHRIADDFVFKVSGQKTFLTKHLVVAASPPQSKSRELYIMDWDGQNKKQLTQHRTVTLSPAWSHDGKKIAYTAFMQRKSTGERNPDLYLYNLETQKSQVVSYRKGMNSGAHFEKNGHLLITISGGDHPDIYRVDTQGQIIKKITHGPLGSMNVEPALSPDGQILAFSSDRAGRPMIYIADREGQNPKRLTFAGTFNAAPSWSPDGKILAFSGWAEKAFDIFTIDVQGQNLKRITQFMKPHGRQASHENPDFSPDGRVIVYTSNRTGSSQLFMSLSDGLEEWRLTEDSWSYYQPKWSP